MSNLQLTPTTVLSDRAYDRQVDRLVDDKELSTITGISRRTFQNWRLRQSGPPFVRAGRAVRYELSAALRWMRQNGHAAAS